MLPNHTDHDGISAQYRGSAGFCLVIHAASMKKPPFTSGYKGAFS